MTLRAVIWCAVSSEKQTQDDKDSLPAQERQAKAFIEKEGWKLVEVLRVRGFSRTFINVEDYRLAMREAGHDAFDRLTELWANEAFDVLIVRDMDRLGRTQTLLSFMVETTISIGSPI